MTTRALKKAGADPDQSARFIETASELGCDKFPDAFEAAAQAVVRNNAIEEKAATLTSRLLIKNL